MKILKKYTVSLFSSLQFTFIRQVNHCTSHAERQLRNDLVVIIALIASKCPSAPFVESGLSRTISLYSSFPEIPSHMEQVKNLKLTSCMEDFEWKRILFNTLAILSKNSPSLQIMSQQQVFLSLFSYVKPIDDNLMFWTLAEFEELQLQAMAVLATLSPLCINDYMSCQGNTRLLMLLDWCISSGKVK